MERTEILPYVHETGESVGVLLRGGHVRGAPRLKTPGSRAAACKMEVLR
jgi:hypothetical protein